MSYKIIQEMKESHLVLFIALIVFSATAESNLNNKRAGKLTRLSYFDLDLIEYLDCVRI